jgi:sterol desaturase/sphingolipid hydroxylase (fatty acid hydroxylase superfamily)
MSEPLNLYAILAPFILIIIVAEFIYCLWKKNGYYGFQDSLMGMGTMIIAQCINVAVSVAVVISYGWIYQKFAITHIEYSLLNFLLCYLGVDFLFYWFHRAGHRINLFWAMHVPHHSAEELNYAVGLRASFFQRAASFLFYWPLAVIGFSPEIILPVVALNLILQLLSHTRVIPKLPSWIDSWLNTPYHHQVHHAANPIYWDRNYGGTLIIWDKLFGSYRDQTEELFYGVTIHPKSWDPTWINFHWFSVLWNDCRQATHFVDKIQLWFRPPGWRPRNLPPYEKLPHKNAQEQIKYQTHELKGSRAYLIFQMIFGLVLMFLVIGHHSGLTTTQKIILSLLLWLQVTGWGMILESKSYAKVFEMIRIPLLAGFLIWIYSTSMATTTIVPALVVIAVLSLFQMGWIFKLRS